jgi:hypothetical protein
MKIFKLAVAAPLLFVAQPGAGEPDSAKRVKGYYRAGSDFRNDGEAVGW